MMLEAARSARKHPRTHHERKEGEQGVEEGTSLIYGYESRGWTRLSRLAVMVFLERAIREVERGSTLPPLTRGLIIISLLCHLPFEIAVYIQFSAMMLRTRRPRVIIRVMPRCHRGYSSWDAASRERASMTWSIRDRRIAKTEIEGIIEFRAIEMNESGRRRRNSCVMSREAIAARTTLFPRSSL